jgi:hypothetical protein
MGVAKGNAEYQAALTNNSDGKNVYERLAF